MPPTYTTDVANWIPNVISASVYDTMFSSDLTLNTLSATYGDLEGRPGQQVTIPTVLTTAPADDLAENVAAVDDRLQSGGVTVTIKEAVKSIAYSDRTRFQSGVDVNRIAGQRVGGGMADRVELDLGAALLTGRNTAKDSNGATFDLSAVRIMRKQIPAKLRRRGLVLLGESATLDALLDDTTINNAAAFGDNTAITEGRIARLYGIDIMAVDDGVFGNITVLTTHTGPAVVLMARGMLARAFQKLPSSEVERDARGRLTRIVGTTLHGEGVVDNRGVVARAIVA